MARTQSEYVSTCILSPWISTRFAAFLLRYISQCCEKGGNPFKQTLAIRKLLCKVLHAQLILGFCITSKFYTFLYLFHYRCSELSHLR
mmetsp:Transcript_2780/g.10694  ORF Transcript_2780/g.10694 Transcript_2780/m.10694 type:complete len:88 (+) Transcript_2780:743-1006(+)